MAEPTTVDVRPKAPLVVRGRLRLQAPGGQPPREQEYRVALCGAARARTSPSATTAIERSASEAAAPVTPASITAWPMATCLEATGDRVPAVDR